MSFIFDTGPFSALHRNFYPSVFTTLWENFDAMVAEGSILSVRECLRELEDDMDASRQWAAMNAAIFHVPCAAEASFIASIYAVPHFQQNIEQQKLLKGGKLADPFVIAKASVEGKTVVTTEKWKPNSVKIPNICRHFDVPCLSLQEFMETQGWRF
jgi:Domain of unknown function (DUF4411)